MTKAYEDAEFMLSDEARSLRLLSEYLEPRERLKKLNVHRALIFWGSARLRPIGPDNLPPSLAAGRVTSLPIALKNPSERREMRAFPLRARLRAPQRLAPGVLAP